jgi:hypothetical protein
MPLFQGQLERQEEWLAWFRSHRDDIHRHFDAAQAKAFDDHLAARGAAQRS